MSAKSSCLALCEPHWVSEQRSTTESGCARPLHGLHESARLAVADTLGSNKGCFNCIICLTGLIGIRIQSRAHDGYSVRSQLLGRYPSRTHRTHRTCRIGDVRQRRTKPGKTYPFSIRQDAQKKMVSGNWCCCLASSIAFAFAVLSIAHTGMNAASFMICSRASISKMTATDCASVEFMDFVPKFFHEAMTR